MLNVISLEPAAPFVKHTDHLQDALASVILDTAELVCVGDSGRPQLLRLIRRIVLDVSPEACQKILAEVFSQTEGND